MIFLFQHLHTRWISAYNFIGSNLITNSWSISSSLTSAYRSICFKFYQNIIPNYYCWMEYIYTYIKTRLFRRYVNLLPCSTLSHAFWIIYPPIPFVSWQRGVTGSVSEKRSFHRLLIPSFVKLFHNVYY